MTWNTLITPLITGYNDVTSTGKYLKQGGRGGVAQYTTTYYFSFLEWKGSGTGSKSIAKPDRGDCRQGGDVFFGGGEGGGGGWWYTLKREVTNSLYPHFQERKKAILVLMQQFYK